MRLQPPFAMSEQLFDLVFSYPVMLVGIEHRYYRKDYREEVLEHKRMIKLRFNNSLIVLGFDYH